jgi:hypothetical protein
MPAPFGLKPVSGALCGIFARNTGSEGQHDRLAAAILRAGDQRAHELVVARPVELEPARHLAHHRRAVLHPHGGLVGEDEADAFRGGRAGHREVGLAVRHLQHADRREQEGRAVRAAEQFDR